MWVLQWFACCATPMNLKDLVSWQVSKSRRSKTPQVCKLARTYVKIFHEILSMCIPRGTKKGWAKLRGWLEMKIFCNLIAIKPYFDRWSHGRSLYADVNAVMRSPSNVSKAWCWSLGYAERDHFCLQPSAIFFQLFSFVIKTKVVQNVNRMSER